VGGEGVVKASSWALTLSSALPTFVTQSPKWRIAPSKPALCDPTRAAAGAGRRVDALTMVREGAECSRIGASARCPLPVQFDAEEGGRKRRRAGAAIE